MLNDNTLEWKHVWSLRKAAGLGGVGESRYGGGIGGEGDGEMTLSPYQPSHLEPDKEKAIQTQ